MKAQGDENLQQTMPDTNTEKIKSVKQGKCTWSVNALEFLKCKMFPSCSMNQVYCENMNILCLIQYKSTKNTFKKIYI